MKSPEENKHGEGRGCPSSDLLAVRPPASLPNGKRNPEYTRWYRTTEKGKAQLAKWRASEGYKKSQAKYQKSDLARQTRHRQYKEKYPDGKRRCVECGSEYHTPDVLSREWPLVGNYGCVCDLCG